MPRVVSWDDALAAVQRYKGRTVLVIGHGTRSAFKELPAVMAQAQSMAATFDATCGGRGQWLIVYGGDPTSRKSPGVGDVVEMLHTICGAPVLAIQSSHVERRGGVPTWCDLAHYYDAERGADGRFVFGGTVHDPSAPSGRRPVGATALYLSEAFRKCLCGVVAFGGGPTASAEARYAVATGCRFKYYMCRVKNRDRDAAEEYLKKLRGGDGSGSGNGGGGGQGASSGAAASGEAVGDPVSVDDVTDYGAIHAWAHSIRAVGRRVLRPSPARAAASTTTSATGSGAGSGGARVDDVGDSARDAVLREQNSRDTGMCLTMHQPWASLLVMGIKRAEGRTWDTRFRGPLWIHAAAKEPDPEELKTWEQSYQQIHEIGGHAGRVEFPKHYPTSALLGRVDVADVVSASTFASMPFDDESVRLESESPFVFLCQNPYRLVVQQGSVKGQHKLWQLEKKVYEGAQEALRKVKGPNPVVFKEIP